jgi:hypothetical protein
LEEEVVYINGTAQTGANVLKMENKPEIVLILALVLIHIKIPKLIKTALILLQNLKMIKIRK